MAVNAEEVLIRLRQEVSGPAGAASSALSKLEAQIRQEQAALGALEAKATTAAAKLQAMSQGVDGSVNIAAFRRQQEAVAALQAQLEKRSANVAGLESARGLAEQADAARAAAAAQRELAAAERMAAAAAKADAAATSSAEKAAMADAARAAAAAERELAAAEREVAAAAKAAKVEQQAMAKAEQEAAKAAHAEQQALAKALPTGQVNQMAEAFGRLPGPIGDAGQKIFGLADGLKKMGGASGSAFTIFAAGAAIAVAAIVGLTVAVVSLTAKLVRWADTNGRIAKAQETLEKNMKATFGGAIKIDALLDGLDKLVALFDKNTASGRALAFITGKIFQPLIDAAVAAIPYVERAFVVLLTWTLKAYIAIKKFSDSKIGAALITGLKVVAALMAVVIAVFVAGAALLVLPFVLVGAAIAAVIVFIGMLISNIISVAGAIASAASSAWAALTGAVQSAIDWLSSLSLSEIGSDMINGLVSGITSAAGAVLSAITGVVGGAIDAAKSLLGISSPSKVFAQLGIQTGEGAAEGIETTAPAVQESMSAMMAPPAAGAPGAPGATGKASAGVMFMFTNCTFGGDLTESKLEEWLDAIVERKALASQGGG